MHLLNSRHLNLLLLKRDIFWEILLLIKWIFRYIFLIFIIYWWLNRIFKFNLFLFRLILPLVIRLVLRNSLKTFIDFPELIKFFSIFFNGWYIYCIINVLLVSTFLLSSRGLFLLLLLIFRQVGRLCVLHKIGWLILIFVLSWLIWIHLFK